jgi:hypothetical protein
LTAAKQADPSFVIDEDAYELLKKITKCKDYSGKYKERAQTLLDSILNSEMMSD